MDEWTLERIRGGLRVIQETLANADPQKRSVKILPPSAMFTFFEALSCPAFFENEHLLTQHFDVICSLLKKPLKVQVYLPAMTKLVFSPSEQRRAYASGSWATMRRPMLECEFDWNVRTYLTEAMLRVQMSCLDIDFQPVFWRGVRAILQQLNKDTITHGIRGLDLDLCRLILDHLQLDTPAFTDLISCMHDLVTKAPADFWDAMGTISASTVVEQALGSPYFKRLLAEFDGSEAKRTTLQQAFRWVKPFLASIKNANLAPACRTLASQVIVRIQQESYPAVPKNLAMQQGLDILAYTLQRLNEGSTPDTFVGQPTVNAMLELLAIHVDRILSVSNLKDPKHSSLALQIVERAFTLECIALEIEQGCIIENRPSPTESPKSERFWSAVIDTIDARHRLFAVCMVRAGKRMLGIEPFFDQSSAALPAVKHFNKKFELLSLTIDDVVQKLNLLQPRQLQQLLEEPSAAMAMVANLFSSWMATRLDTIEFFKVVSGRDDRFGALQHIITTQYSSFAEGFSNACRATMKRKVYAPVPSMIKTCTDVVDVLSNSSGGILRSRALEGKELDLTMGLWQTLWVALTTIFKTMEAWTSIGYDKASMIEFCRDTMQFADQLFNQCSVFASALRGLDSRDGKTGPSLLQRLLSSPVRAMRSMAGWLRLRDEFLVTTAVTLTSKLLVRLRKASMDAEPDATSFVEHIVTGIVRSKLSVQQKAELQRALEAHLGRPIMQKEPAKESKKQQASLSKFVAKGETEAKPASSSAELLARTTATADGFKRQRDAFRLKPAAPPPPTLQQRKQAEFLAKREADKKASQKAREQAAAAAARKRVGLALNDAGSGLKGLGVPDKEHAQKGEGMMVSDSSSDEEEVVVAHFQPVKGVNGPKTNIVSQDLVNMPFKKKKLVRSANDMRARLAPDLSPLHAAILSWEFFAAGDYPPGSLPNVYSTVPSKFRTPNDYRAVFDPLLKLEAWQSFVKTREETSSWKVYPIQVVSRCAIDSWAEVSTVLDTTIHKDCGAVSEGDVVIFSRSKQPCAEEPHCLARVREVKRQKDNVAIVYRCVSASPLHKFLGPKHDVWAAKIQSLIPLEREYGALSGLQYYDLSDEIIKGKPSPLLKYSDDQLRSVLQAYDVNKAQAKAVMSALDNDAFTLIQG